MQYGYNYFPTIPNELWHHFYILISSDPDFYPSFISWQHLGTKQNPGVDFKVTMASEMRWMTAFTHLMYACFLLSPKDSVVRQASLQVFFDNLSSVGGLVIAEMWRCLGTYATRCLCTTSCKKIPEYHVLGGVGAETKDYFVCW